MCKAVSPNLLLTWNGSSWFTETNQVFGSVTPSTSPTSISCPSAAFCKAVGSYAFTWNGATWSQDANYPLPGSLQKVSCSSEVFCKATSSYAIASWRKATDWSTEPFFSVANSGGILTIACPPNGACVAGGGDMGAALLLSSTEVTVSIESPLPNYVLDGSPILFGVLVPLASQVKMVEFMVKYDGRWRDIRAVIASQPPFEVIWQPPAGLRSQRVTLAARVIANSGQIAGVVERSLTYLESKGDPVTTENWIANRFYINQLAMGSEGSSLCAPSSLTMWLAMRGLIGTSDSTISSMVQTIWNKVKVQLPSGNTGSSPARFKQALGSLGFGIDRLTLSSEQAWTRLMAEIDSQSPVVIRTAHGVVAPDGHYVVAVGYRQHGALKEVIVYDPNGKWLGNGVLNYDRNLPQLSSHKGKWQIYAFDTIFGESNDIFVAPSQSTGRVIELAALPTSPPDEVSAERVTLFSYLGADASNQLVIPVVYLPLISR